MNKVFGSIVATAVAGIMVAAPAAKAEDTAPGGEKMGCQNNTCKGKAACKGFDNASCAGKNSCKGHGIVKAKDEAACTKKGGTWAAMK